MSKITGYDAIRYAIEEGVDLNKYEDPVDAAQEGISMECAIEVASEDPSLIYVNTKGPEEVSFEFVTKEQSWQDETTRYWFEAQEGAVELDEDLELHQELCVSDTNGEVTILDEDGYPIIEGMLSPRARRALMESYEEQADE